MSDEQKEYTADELLHKMRRDWDVGALNPDRHVVLEHWFKQAEAVLKRANELGERDANAVKAKLYRLLEELGITETAKLQLDEAVQNAQRILNEVRHRRRFAWIRRDVLTLRTENQPPMSAEKLLYLALPKRLRDSLIGDLEEEFTTQILPKFGPSFAKVWYWKQAAWSVAAVAARQLVKLVGVAWLGKAASWLYGKLGS
ncbi:MAG TPA: hypothetical protein VK138_03665 [Acidiferrobacterales bacterium]|nr:hypothetical protein [Acidiferrobacterales bacterium]